MSAPRPDVVPSFPSASNRPVRRPTALLEARRRAAVELVEAGVPQVEVARRFGVTRAAVCLWSQAARARGPAGLSAIPRPGRPARIPKDRSAGIADLVRRGPRAFGVDADRWSGARMRTFIEERWGLRVSESTLRRWMRRHQILWDVARDRSESAPLRAPHTSPRETPRGRPPFVRFILAFGRLPAPSAPPEPTAGMTP